MCGNYEYEVNSNLEIASKGENTNKYNNETEINNDSLIGKVSKIKNSGIQNITVNNTTYSADVLVYNNGLTLNGSNIQGATFGENVYEFGNKETDVAKENSDGTISDAQNMVILKVFGDLVIEEGITLTSCKSDNGYGGPKGMMIYCTGNIIDNGTISMTARGARAEGQNVYLWKNENDTQNYEIVPADGALGRNRVWWTISM